MNLFSHPVLRVLPLVFLALRSLHAQSVEAPVVASGTTQPAAEEQVNDRVEKKSAARSTLSPRLTALLCASLPKFVPPSDSSAAKNSADETDNPIFRLPKLVVRGPRAPVFSERDLLSYDGLKAIAEKKYITTFDRVLNTIHIPFLTPALGGRALAMYDEDERLKKMADLDRSARTAALADPIAAADLKRLAAATYQRTAEFGGEHGPN